MNNSIRRKKKQRIGYLLIFLQCFCTYVISQNIPIPLPSAEGLRSLTWMHTLPVNQYLPAEDVFISLDIYFPWTTQTSYFYPFLRKMVLIDHQTNIVGSFSFSEEETTKFPVKSIDKVRIVRFGDSNNTHFTLPLQYHHRLYRFQSSSLGELSINFYGFIFNEAWRTLIEYSDAELNSNYLFVIHGLKDTVNGSPLYTNQFFLKIDIVATLSSPSLPPSQILGTSPTDYSTDTYQYCSTFYGDFYLMAGRAATSTTGLRDLSFYLKSSLSIQKHMTLIFSEEVGNFTKIEVNPFNSNNYFLQTSHGISHFDTSPISGPAIFLGGFVTEYTLQDHIHLKAYSIIPNTKILFLLISTEFDAATGMASNSTSNVYTHLRFLTIDDLSPTIPAFFNSFSGYALDLINTQEIIMNSYSCCKMGADKMYFIYSYVSTFLSQMQSESRVYSIPYNGKCTKDNCITCDTQNTSCVMCRQGYSLDLPSGSCLPANNLPSGFVDLERVIHRCSVVGCSRCESGVNVCDLCMEGAVKIDMKTCAVEVVYKITIVRTDGYLKYRLDVQTRGEFELSRDLKMVIRKKWLVVKGRFMFGKQIDQEGRVQLIVTGDDGVGRYSATASSDDITFPSIKTNKIIMSVEEGEAYLYRGVWYKIQATSASHRYLPQFIKSELTAFKKTGSFLGYATLAMDNYFSGLIFTTISILDQTNTILLFGHFMQITSRMRYANINYGKGLKSFLDEVGDPVMPLTPNNTHLDVKNSVGFRGRLSKKYLDLQFNLVLIDKLIVYIVSWIVLLVNETMKNLQVRLPLMYIKYILIFHPIIHFKLVFSFLPDFLFYGVRCMTHASADLWFHVLVSVIVLLMISLDLSIMYSCTYYESCWYEHIDRDLEREEKKKIEMGKGEKLEKSSKSPEAENLNILPVPGRTSPPNPQNQESPQQEDTAKQVDYEKTYERTSLSRGATFTLSSMIVRSKRNLSLTSTSRNYMAWHTTRLVIYNTTVVTCQFSSGLMVATWFAGQLLHMIFIIRNYQSKREKRTIGHLRSVQDFLQGVFLLVIIIYMFFMHFVDETVSPSMSSQVLIVVIVFVAVLTEWVLALSSIITTLWSKFIQNNDDNNKREDVIVVYYPMKSNDDDNSRMPLDIRNLIDSNRGNP